MSATGKKSADDRKSESGKSSVIDGLEPVMFEKQTRLAISLIPNNKISAKFIILQILWLLIFALGIFCVVHSKLYVYLFWMNSWKLSAPNIFVCVAEYLGMTAGMIMISHFVMSLSAKQK